MDHRRLQKRKLGQKHLGNNGTLFKGSAVEAMTLKGLNLVVLKPLGTLIATAASYLKHYYTQMTSQTLLEFYTYYEHRSDTF